MESGLILKREHYQIMLEDVVSRAPNEACGIVAGLDSHSEKIYRITNISKSNNRFLMDPEEQLIAFNDIEHHGYKLLAIYHSHPEGPDGPSNTDILEFAYPDTMYLIWSYSTHYWECHGYTITDRAIIEMPLLIIQNE